MMRNWISRHQHVYWLLYFPIYLLIFELLECRTSVSPHVISFSADNLIPFCSWFVIPYFLWFAFIAFAVGTTFFRNVPEFRKLMQFLAIGMTIFLVISAIFPTELKLRPSLTDDGNILTRLVMLLYMIDTPTNVFPSIHVFNSIGCLIAILRTFPQPKYRLLRAGSWSLSILIILSTMFLKQHSILDVTGGLILAVITYVWVYPRPTAHPQRLRRTSRQKQEM